MHLEILVEELSAEVVLRDLIPKVISDDHSFLIRTFRGKQNLLKKLPERLSGYRQWIKDADTRVVVLLDRDGEDCVDLKARLEDLAQRAGLPTKTRPDPDGSFLVVNRIAIEELEAWFFGDCDAVRRVYPRVPASLGQKQAFRDPDAVSGGTAERFEKVLKDVGYVRGGYNKVAGASAIAKHMDPARNRSRSFQVFVEGIRHAVS